MALTPFSLLRNACRLALDGQGGFALQNPEHREIVASLGGLDSDRDRTFIHLTSLVLDPARAFPVKLQRMVRDVASLSQPGQALPPEPDPTTLLVRIPAELALKAFSLGIDIPELVPTCPSFSWLDEILERSSGPDMPAHSMSAPINLHELMIRLLMTGLNANTTQPTFSFEALFFAAQSMPNYSALEPLLAELIAEYTRQSEAFYSRLEVDQAFGMTLKKLPSFLSEAQLFVTSLRGEAAAQAMRFISAQRERLGTLIKDDVSFSDLMDFKPPQIVARQKYLLTFEGQRAAVDKVMHLVPFFSSKRKP